MPGESGLLHIFICSTYTYLVNAYCVLDVPSPTVSVGHSNKYSIEAVKPHRTGRKAGGGQVFLAELLSTLMKSESGRNEASQAGSG